MTEGGMGQKYDRNCKGQKVRKMEMFEKGLISGWLDERRMQGNGER